MSEREAIADLVAEYAALLDEDHLEEWLDLFASQCSYCVTTRENLAEDLPLPLLLCANKDMLRDRIAALRDVSKYNVHSSRHVVGSLRFRGAADGLWRVEAGFSLFQTDTEGYTRLFVVGGYEFSIVFENGQPLLCEVVAMLDTAAIPTLLANPV